MTYYFSKITELNGLKHSTKMGHVPANTQAYSRLENHTHDVAICI